MTDHMFARFTEGAREVVRGARACAALTRSHFVGTEHVLFALASVGTGDIAQVALQELGVRDDSIALPVDDAESRERVPFTPRATKLLEHSLREALSLGHDYIGPEHLLLALIRTEDSKGMEILRDLGADSEKVRNEVMRQTQASRSLRRRNERPHPRGDANPAGAVAIAAASARQSTRGPDEITEAEIASYLEKAGSDPEQLARVILAEAECARDWARRYGEAVSDLERADRNLAYLRHRVETALR